MLVEREFCCEDILKIEMNEYAEKHSRERCILTGLLNDLEIRTVCSEDKIEAIMFCGKLRDNTDRWYVFAIYAKDCSKMIARHVRKKIIEKSKKGYHIVTDNDEQGLEKFHSFIFREKL